MKLPSGEKIKNSKDPDNFRDYLKKYPNGKYVALARERLSALQEEETAWEKIKNSDRVEDFEKFLTDYKNGKFADQAETRLKDLRKKKDEEEIEWEPTENSNDPKVFIIYLNNYPRGKYIKEAQGQLRDFAGTVIRNPIGMELVLIPPGSFMMGANNISSDEKPVHRVTINNGFYMGKYEVTIAEWRKVMVDLPEGMKKDLDSKFKRSDRQPVLRVKWDEMQEFIGKLNARGDGYTYRLPSEAEWEYACRAKTTTPLRVRLSLSSEQANFNGNGPYGAAAKGVFGRRRSGGKFSAERLGLVRHAWECVGVV